MREIKFRGVTSFSKTMVYGKSLIQGEIEGRKFTQIEQTIESDFHQWDVIPETVGQFTGLKDKNGVDIYEGDLVEIQFPSKQKVQAEIVFEYCSLVMAMDEYANRDFATAMEECENSDLRLHELLTIIGNIHETPTT